MKSKLVIWGKKNDERVLLALSLRALESKYDIYIFPENETTETFYNALNNEWKSGQEIEFPANHTKIEKDLTASGSLLPDGVESDNPDILQRAQTEWQFAVLSAKLTDSYNSELSVFKDKINDIESFSQELWNDLKSFWDKVSTQIKEKNLFKEHIDDLRAKTNELFDALKVKRKEMDKQFEQKSGEVKATFMNQLQEIQQKVEKGLSLHPLFEELKQLQSKYHSAVMSNSDKKSVWEKLDSTFKAIKEKRFGKGGDAVSQNGSKARLDNRYAGLLTAIEKMEKSIKFDLQELEFQNKRINDPVGQLEAQIRQAKLKMIEDKIASKKSKLNDMLKTKEELEAKKAKLDRLETERAEAEQAKKAAQEKIAAEIKAASEMRADHNPDLEKAAQKIAESKNQQTHEKETVLGAISTVIGESLSDVVDTVKAVAEVLEDKIEDTIDNIKERFSDDKEEE